jgi:hypothetical protein
VIRPGPLVKYLWTYNDTTHSILSDQLSYIQFEGIKGVSYVGISLGTWQGDNNQYAPSQITFNNVESENFAFDMVTYATYSYQLNFNQLTLMLPRNAGLVMDGINQATFNGVEISNYNTTDPILGNSGNSTDVCLGDCVNYQRINSLASRFLDSNLLIRLTSRGFVSAWDCSSPAFRIFRAALMSLWRMRPHFRH